MLFCPRGSETVQFHGLLLAFHNLIVFVGDGEVIEENFMVTHDEVFEIPLEPLQVEAFSPYGIVIKALPPNHQAKFEMHNLSFEVDGTPELFIVSYPFQEMEFSTFERHRTMTEARVSLGGAVVIVVAEETPMDDRNSFPDPETFRAFLIPSNQGIMIHKGSWHCIDCFPVRPGHVDFAFFTEAESEDEFFDFEDSDKVNFQRSDLFDYKEEKGISFRITDPDGLLASA